MDKIDIGLIQFLWVAMAVPIGWLFILLNNLRKDLNEAVAAINEAKERANSAQSKADHAINETRVREILKEEIGPISKDIKDLTETINKAMREFDNKIFNLALDNAKSNNKGVGINEH
jgi:predicted  nucleic acid-binding Zn-ribbon protein